VVYKWYEIGNSWNQRRYLLRGTSNVYRAKLSAVAEALAIAFSWAIHKQVLDENSPQLESRVHEISIFTDSQDVLTKLENLRHRALTERQMQGDFILRKLITRSQYLRRLGVRVELRWVPGHARVEGNERADKAARRAAKNGVDSNVPDEGLELVAAELARQ
jgi:ribonuclease HI